MTVPTTRTLNLLGFFACAGMMAYALYAQYVLYLDPCPLCIFQRIAVIGMGIAFLLLAIHNPGPGIARKGYLGLFGISSLAGIGVAGRHVWLQYLPADEVPACGPGLSYMLDTFPLGDALKMVFEGSGECAGVDWTFVGLSMPEWVLLMIILLTVFAIWNNRRASA
ncbi:MAG: disulfide bond formation protein B [Pseudomonadota bacterium]